MEKNEHETPLYLQYTNICFLVQTHAASHKMGRRHDQGHGRYRGAQHMPPRVGGRRQTAILRGDQVQGSVT